MGQGAKADQATHAYMVGAVGPRARCEDSCIDHSLRLHKESVGLNPTHKAPPRHSSWPQGEFMWWLWWGIWAWGLGRGRPVSY